METRIRLPNDPTAFSKTCHGCNRMKLGYRYVQFGLHSVALQLRMKNGAPPSSVNYPIMCVLMLYWSEFTAS